MLMLCHNSKLTVGNPSEIRKFPSNLKAPELTANFQEGKQIQIGLEKTLTLSCNATGSPIPNIVWFKNEEKILCNNQNRTKLFTEKHYQAMSAFRISNIKEDDSGNYSCVAFNTRGLQVKTVEVDVSGECDHKNL